MGLVESLKSAAICGADWVNKLNDPFDHFTRPAIPKVSKRLWDLESEFYQDLVGNFWGCQGQVLLHRIPLPVGSPLDTGDQAIWHGVNTAILALRYHLQDAVQQTDTYGYLVSAVKGLLLHQTAHGEAQPRLIRGVSDDLKTWQDDASNDSATGHLLGIYFVWKYGPPSLQPVCGVLAAGLATELLTHGHALVKADGTPTTYGALEQGWKTDPLRISLALAIYAVAATICKAKPFMDAYSKLYSKYHALAIYPKVKLWWLENQNDTHRAAIHLAILADLTTGKPNEEYVRGLTRIQEMAEKLGNVWVNALCQFGRGGPFLGRGEKEIALKVLSEFTLKDKMFNDGLDNYLLYQTAPGTFPGWRFKPVRWNGKWMANQPLPRWAVRSQDFFWQRNLRSLDPGSNGAVADSRLNGGDFLAAYWLSRLTGILSADD